MQTIPVYPARCFALFLFVLFCISGIRAQEFDNKPLTCTIKDAGDYKVEMAGCSNSLDVYLYDKNLVPVRGKPLSGHVEFFFNSDPPLQSRLVQYHRTNALSAKILAPRFNYCRVTIIVDTFVISVYFDNECELRAAEDRSEGTSDHTRN